MLYVKENKTTHIILKKLVINKACFVVSRFAKLVAKLPSMIERDIGTNIRPILFTVK